jgi:uncharacterized membrane protein
MTSVLPTVPLDPHRPAVAVPPRRIALTLGGVMAVSLALHVVPQALRGWIDPAWSMLALLLVDALLIASLARRWGPLRAAAAIAALLALTIALRQQAFAAAPSISFNLLLAAGFGLTLRPGATPLLAAIARAAHPQLMTAAFERYLRGLTLCWLLFFVAMALASLVLSLVAPFATWSLFVNVLTWPITAALFLLEWAVRRTFFRTLPPHTPWQILSSIFAFPWAGLFAARRPQGATRAGGTG